MRRSDATMMRDARGGDELGSTHAPGLPARPPSITETGVPSRPGVGADAPRAPAPREGAPSACGRAREGSSVAPVAALYVDPRGIYATLPGVECWGLDRDARLYPGPHPVVCHPPCERWGKYWHGGPSARVRRVKGDDGGCFASALASVRAWGGVLEHPEFSAAWSAHGLLAPPYFGGRCVADDVGGWTCRVEQGHYGHRARKGTWLYAVGVELPSLRWGASDARVRLDAGFHSAAERVRAKDRPRQTIERMDKRERAATPAAFASLLVAMARTARPTAVLAAAGAP